MYSNGCCHIRLCTFEFLYILVRQFACNSSVHLNFYICIHTFWQFTGNSSVHLNFYIYIHVRLWQLASISSVHMKFYIVYGNLLTTPLCTFEFVYILLLQFAGNSSRPSAQLATPSQIYIELRHRPSPQ